MFVRASPSPQKLRCLVFHDGSTQGVGWLYRRRRIQKLGLVWHFPESSVPVLQSWEPLVKGAKC